MHSTPYRRDTGSRNTGSSDGAISRSEIIIQHNYFHFTASTSPTPSTTSPACYNKYFDYGALLSGAIEAVNATAPDDPTRGAENALLGAPDGAVYQPGVNLETLPHYEVFLNSETVLTLVRITLTVQDADEVTIEVLTPDGTIYTRVSARWWGFFCPLEPRVHRHADKPDATSIDEWWEMTSLACAEALPSDRGAA